ncbi:hypothetical protein B0H67DRAFT_639175 [Lasiosphaeris hirsuta]|uniref:Uncharacterized protein n=1 Tax=Lasiosphaeris hirsuta TaxID=260670 RepID=A0AA40BB11_9PEZI|nr:hypothetical protein B0H67DRAFT_639175 [Lasiosphaeris hirsuta]
MDSSNNPSGPTSLLNSQSSNVASRRPWGPTLPRVSSPLRRNVCTVCTVGDLETDEDKWSDDDETWPPTHVRQIMKIKKSRHLDRTGSNLKYELRVRVTENLAYERMKGKSGDDDHPGGEGKSGEQDNPHGSSVEGEGDDWDEESWGGGEEEEEDSDEEEKDGDEEEKDGDEEEKDGDEEERDGSSTGGRTECWSWD